MEIRILLLCVVFAFSPNLLAKFVIGVGDEQGSNSAAIGNFVCSFVNGSIKNTNCTIDNESGVAIQYKKFLAGNGNDFTLANGGFMHHILQGNTKRSDIKTIAAFNAEHVVMVVSRESGIKKFSDLKGKRVAIGTPGSQEYNIFATIIKAAGLKMNDFKIVNIAPTEILAGMFAVTADATLLSVRHPNPVISDLLTLENANIISIPDDVSNKIVAEASNAIVRKVLQKDTYKNLISDVNTISSHVLLMVRADVPEDLVYKITKNIIKNRSKLAYIHSSFKALNDQDVANNATIIDLHPGALKYYEEVGLR